MSRSVVAIGNFDGVHQGHRKVLSTALGDGSLPLVVITFWPHPMEVVHPGHGPALLGDLETRITLLKRAGAHEVRVVRFNEDVAGLDPAEFVDRFVVPLGPVRVVVGENFHFGHRAAGSVATLSELGTQRGFEVSAVPLTMVDQTVTCSSYIRQCLREGDVEAAARHLGRPFCFCGVVVVGDQRGRELGYPTANLTVPPGMAVPADGVYAGWVRTEDGQRLPAAISVGTNPTFDGTEKRVESYVLDRDDLELYGTRIVVDFVTRLRGQVRFDDVPGLVAQMERDVDQARALLQA